jgi:hypothetical protein
MQLLSTGIIDHEKVGEMGLCPICKINYITEDETVCSTCYAETDLTDEEITAMYGESKSSNSLGDDTEENEDGLNTIEDDEEELEDEDLEMLNVAGIDADERDKDAEAEEEEEEEGDDDPLADLDEELDELAEEDEEDDDEDDEK